VGLPSAGSVVLIHIPFSDLPQTKLRPALVLADLGLGDLILRQIKSNAFSLDAIINLLQASQQS